MFYIPQSQTPKVKRIQRSLHYQLKHEHMPKEREGTVEEQQQHLQSVFIGKNVLICIDGKAHELRTVLIFVLSYDSSKDCWDQAHYRCFDVIDKQTASMILVSTRISGLISSNACVEVKLSLMSVQVRWHLSHFARIALTTQTNCRKVLKCLPQHQD